MLELLIVVVSALTWVLRGHRELVLENLALRQQLAAYHRTMRCRLRARFLWMALARFWRNWRTALTVVHRTPSSAASRLAAPPAGRDARAVNMKAVQQLISRSARSFARWRPRTPYGARRGFAANCAHSASKSQ